MTKPFAESRLLARIAELMAVGGATFVVFPLALLLRTLFGLDDAELAVGFVMFHAAHFINDPHFAVTYLLFYRGIRARTLGGSRASRTRYLLAGFVAPLVLVAWAATALVLRSAQALGALVQLMFLLVGFHYAKQGFGALSVLSARRGVAWSAAERRALLLHCYAAWTFAWANPTRAAGEFEEKGVVYWGPGSPRWLDLSMLCVFLLSALWLAWTLARKWRREQRLPVMPLAVFLVTVWLWTVFTRLDPLVRYVIPALHSIQYLYFVWLLKRNEARAEEGPPAFGPPVATRLTTLALGALALGFVLFRGAPQLLDGMLATHWGTDAAAEALGETPVFAAFFVVVNIHHYLMDAVIWRRENPDTRYLREPCS